MSSVSPDPEQILAAAERTEADPPRSKLDPFAHALWTLRRKRKRLRAIAAFLREHGVEVSKSTVARWLKSHPQPRSAAANSVTADVPPAARQRARAFFTNTSEDEPL